MQNRNNIPTKFLELAQLEGIRAEIATDYYFRRIEGQSFYDLSLILQADFDNNKLTASRALMRLWNNWKSFTYNNTTLQNKKAVVATEPAHITNTRRQFVKTSSFLDDAREGLEKLIGPVKDIEAPLSRTGLEDTVDVVSDLHIPFHDENSLKKLMTSKSKKLIIVGDLMDCLSATSHRKRGDAVTLQEELAITRSILEKLASKYEEVQILAGNHDNRPTKRFQEQVSGLMPLVIHPLVWLSVGLNNVKLMNFKVPNTKSTLNFSEDVDINYMGLDADCLYGHFEGFCGSEAVKRLDVWISQWIHVLKIKQPKAVFQAHTHRLNMEILPTGRYLFTTGCMCMPQAYQIDGHGKYSPPVLGYVKLFLNKEKTGYDFEKTQLIYTGN